MIDEVSIKISRVPTTISYAAQQALKLELYQYRWWMFHQVLDENHSIIKMATAFYRRKRIGISLFWNYDDLSGYETSDYGTQLGCYVRPEFRRHGIGRMLIERMNVNARVGSGIAESEHFWNKVFDGKPEWFTYG